MSEELVATVRSVKNQTVTLVKGRRTGRSDELWGVITGHQFKIELDTNPGWEKGDIINISLEREEGDE